MICLNKIFKTGTLLKKPQMTNLNSSLCEDYQFNYLSIIFYHNFYSPSYDTVGDFGIM